MTQNKLPRGQFSFCVEPYTEDATGRIAWSTLGNQLLRCAGLHATHNGFGYSQLIEHNLVWVLSRLAMQFDERPQTGQRYTITTWIKSSFRQFTERLFELTDEHGHRLGCAYSIWSAIDFTTRQPVDLNDLPGGGFGEIIIPSPDFPLQSAGRIRLKQPTEVFSHRMGFSDLDINGHVNSMHYLDLLLNFFSLDFYRANRLNYIEIHFCNETYEADSLTLFHEPLADADHLFEIRKEAQAVVRAHILTTPL